MSPGIGVGGYCLTKDPLFARYSENFVADHNTIVSNDFPISSAAVLVNQSMPHHTIRLIRQYLTDKIKNLYILGLAYRSDVGDTRFSPAIDVVLALLSTQHNTHAIDPMLSDAEISALSFPALTKAPDSFIFDSTSLVCILVNHSAFHTLEWNNTISKFIDHQVTILDFCGYFIPDELPPPLVYQLGTNL